MRIGRRERLRFHFPVRQGNEITGTGAERKSPRDLFHPRVPMFWAWRAGSCRCLGDRKARFQQVSSTDFCTAIGWAPIGMMPHRRRRRGAICRTLAAGFMTGYLTFAASDIPVIAGWGDRRLTGRLIQARQVIDPAIVLSHSKRHGFDQLILDLRHLCDRRRSSKYRPDAVRGR